MDTNGHENTEPLMDTNGHEKIQNHEWTRMDTNNEVNHERHERHEKLRTTNGHEWTRILK